jgi:hypothetical protein
MPIGAWSSSLEAAMRADIGNSTMRRLRAGLGATVDQLIADLAGIVCGPALRCGALLNYLNPRCSSASSRTVDALRYVVEQMVEAERGPCSAHGILVLVADDCLAVLDTVKLQGRTLMPRGIRFIDSDQGGVCRDTTVVLADCGRCTGVRWMTDVEQAGLDAQLRALSTRLWHEAMEQRRAIADAVEKDKNTSTAALGTTTMTMARMTTAATTTTTKRSWPCPPVLEACMDGVVTVSLPTVYGYILGYPCTFEILSREHGAAVSRWLSSSVLVFYYYRARHRVYSQRLGDDSVLLSFSVPKELVESPGRDWAGLLRAWRREMQGVDGGLRLGEMWAGGECTTEVASCRGVAI